MAAFDLTNWFGPIFHEFHCVISDGLHRGWSSNGMGDSTAQEIVDKNASVAASVGVRNLSGISPQIIRLLNLPKNAESQTFVYGLERIEEVGIAEVCDVGMPEFVYLATELGSILDAAEKAGQNTNDLREMLLARVSGNAREETRKKVALFLSQMQEIAPFRITVASPRSLEGIFLSPVENGVAGSIEDLVFDVVPTAYEAVLPLTLKDYILENQAFALCWP